MTEYVSWLNLNKNNLDQGDVLSAGIEQLNFASTGFLSKAENSKTKFLPIIKTSARAMEIEATKLRVMPDALELLRSYQPGTKPLVLAARVTGEVETAFSEGKPEEEKNNDDDKNKKTEASKEKNSVNKHLKKGHINAIVVADTDMLHDQFWVDQRNLFGQQLLIPHAHNATFIVNALDNLSGSESLIALRGRGVNNRPFELVETIRRNAEQQYRQKEQKLLASLKDVRAELDKIENSSKGKSVILSADDKRKIEEFRSRMIEIRKELRAVKHALRKDIDRLDGTLKFANIAGVPLLLLFGLLTFGIARRYWKN